MLCNNQVIDNDNNIKAKDVIKIKNKYANMSERQLKHSESADLCQGQYIGSSNIRLPNMLGCFVIKASWLCKINGQRSPKCNDHFLGSLLNTS